LEAAYSLGESYGIAFVAIRFDQGCRQCEIGACGIIVHGGEDDVVDQWHALVADKARIFRDGVDHVILIDTVIGPCDIVVVVYAVIGTPSSTSSSSTTTTTTTLERTSIRCGLQPRAIVVDGIDGPSTTIRLGITDFAMTMMTMVLE
jgi:hypothetical protein